MTQQGAASEPVWHRPAWITAIVGVISAFLTIPQVVGDYLSKDLEIEAAKIGNAGLVQSQEFEVVKNTLSRQGEERIFMLRYFAATHDDPEAREWARLEVERLDQLATLRAQVERQRLELEEKEAELARAEGGDGSGEGGTELTTLRSELEKTSVALDELRSRAGVYQTAPPADAVAAGGRSFDYFTERDVSLQLDWDRDAPYPTDAVVRLGAFTGTCPNGLPRCALTIPEQDTPAGEIDIGGPVTAASADAVVKIGERDAWGPLPWYTETYACEGPPGRIVCARRSEGPRRWPGPLPR